MSVQVFPEVKQLYESAARPDLLLDVVCKSRIDADLVYADELLGRLTALCLADLILSVVTTERQTEV